MDSPYENLARVPFAEIAEKARHIAAQCWCDEQTKDIPMDSRLAHAFACRLDDQMRQRAIAEALYDEARQRLAKCPHADDLVEMVDVQFSQRQATQSLTTRPIPKLVDTADGK